MTKITIIITDAITTMTLITIPAIAPGGKPLFFPLSPPSFFFSLINNSLIFVQQWTLIHIITINILIFIFNWKDNRTHCFQIPSPNFPSMKLNESESKFSVDYKQLNTDQNSIYFTFHMKNKIFPNLCIH